MSIRDDLAEVLVKHGPSGFVSSRDGWVECACGSRLPLTLSSDGYADMEEEDAAWAEHRADAILASGFFDKLSQDKALVERMRANLPYYPPTTTSLKIYLDALADALADALSVVEQ